MSKNGQLYVLAQGLSNVTHSPTFILFTPQETLRASHLIRMFSAFTSTRYGYINFLVHSGGGDINVAYQIAEFLREHCDKMRLFVPLFAKSAATIFALASDEIIMCDFAELGPLDTQILEERGRGERKFSSALNPFKSLSQIQSFSLETMDLVVKLLVRRSTLTVDEAIGKAIKFSAGISNPLYEKLDIEKLGEYSRALMIGKEYGVRLLHRYNKNMDADRRDTVVDRLVYGYPSHDYIIDYKELIDLGFSARRPGLDEKNVLDSIIKYLLDNPSQTEIMLVEEKTPSLPVVTHNTNKRKYRKRNVKNKV